MSQVTPEVTAYQKYLEAKRNKDPLTRQVEEFLGVSLSVYLLGEDEFVPGMKPTMLRRRNELIL